MTSLVTWFTELPGHVANAVATEPALGAALILAVAGVAVRWWRR